MVRAMSHRGPDDSGTACLTQDDREIWLGSTRLAIIDLSEAGHMPMTDGHGRHIVYNGEVYNFAELRPSVEDPADPLHSHTDTEVVLRMSRDGDTAFLSRLRGMFAFAIWDERAGELLLVRDRAGKKPLYYATVGDSFVFASEVRAILASGLVERKLDPTGLAVYLANGFTVTPTTLVEGVRSLPAGHAMRVSADGQILDTWSYWAPPGPDQEIGADVGADELKARLRSTLAEATTMRLVSDVPLGVFLSGGLDSSILATLLHRAGTDVRTFSISFPGDDLDEASFSRSVAETLGTRHTEVPITEESFHAWLPDALDAMDQPTFDGVNTYFVARAAREGGLTVALSGLGADELFGGYPFFRTVPWMASLARTAQRVPSMAPVVKPSLSERLGRSGALRLAGPWKLLDLVDDEVGGASAVDPTIVAYQAAQALFPSWGRSTLLGDVADGQGSGEGLCASVGLPTETVERLAHDVEGLDAVTATSMLTWRLFLGERALRDTDQMSMGVSLEVRAPFVDHVLVEQLLAVPGRIRAAGAPNKPFEHEIVADELDGVWSMRPKQGFVFPFARWLRGEVGVAAVEETVHDARLLESIGLSPRAVRSVWDAHVAHPERVPWSRVWAIHTLARWCARWEVTR